MFIPYTDGPKYDEKSLERAWAIDLSSTARQKQPMIVFRRFLLSVSLLLAACAAQPLPSPEAAKLAGNAPVETCQLEYGISC